MCKRFVLYGFVLRVLVAIVTSFVSFKVPQSAGWTVPRGTARNGIWRYGVQINDFESWLGISFSANTAVFFAWKVPIQTVMTSPRVGVGSGVWVWVSSRRRRWWRWWRRWWSGKGEEWWRVIPAGDPSNRWIIPVIIWIGWLIIKLITGTESNNHFLTRFIWVSQAWINWVIWISAVSSWMFVVFI